MDTLLEKLKKHAAAGPLPMHMPGHKRNAAAFPWLAELGCALDMTEISGFDDLNAPRGLFRDLEERTAKLWGAGESICLVGGSTSAVLAAVRSALERGGALLLFRGCHRSVYHAAELAGAETYYLTPRLDRELGTWGSVTAEEVARGLDAHPDVRLVAITSPTYEGVISDVRAIAQICHRRGVPLFVDEAHGAHLGFGGFPGSAVGCGADLVAQSLHKTLPSLTQTAVLHVSGDLVDPMDVRRNAAMFQSSSPSYLLSASIDGCIRYLEREGTAAAGRWLAALTDFYGSVADLEHLRVWQGGEGVFARDPSKIVISTAAADLTGAELMGLLRERFHVELEMASGRYALAMTGMGDTAGSMQRLAEAIRGADRLCGAAACPRRMQSDPLPARRMSIREALTAPGRFCPLTDAVGRISGEYVWSYPPGSPLLVPGEVVDGETVKAICSGINIHSTRGAAPGQLFCIGND